MKSDPIANMRSRVEMCRRLAVNAPDARTAKILRQMADEGETDIKRLEEERRQSSGDQEQAGN
jgi:phosphoribosylpyrophosphate synthetase